MIRSLRSVASAIALVALLAAPAAALAADLSGCWSGTWNSCQTRHRGPLFAEFVRRSENQYEVFFRGRFFKVLPFKYSVVMDAVEQPDGVVQLTGSLYLGRMFGTFTFSAAASDCQFNANYSSCEDNGQFLLSRCTRAATCYEQPAQ